MSFCNLFLDGQGGKINIFSIKTEGGDFHPPILKKIMVVVSFYPHKKLHILLESKMVGCKLK